MPIHTIKALQMMVVITKGTIATMVARRLRKVSRHSSAVAPYTARYISKMPRSTSMLVAASIPAEPAASKKRGPPSAEALLCSAAKASLT